jgi:integrase
MGRKKHPEPFWRSERSCYFVQIGKKQVRLSPDHDEAYRLYHELMSKPPEARVPVATGPPKLVVELLDQFLDWTSRNNAARTYAWYRENIQQFVVALPPGLTIAELKPFHVTRALDQHPNWANNTKNDFIGAVKRAFNWALDEELIDRSPLARMKKPAREAREMAISPAEYAAIIAAIGEPTFRDLVEMAWETGARVQELRKIEARFLDLGNARIVFPPKQAKGKKYYRVIYLTERAREIVRHLAEKRPTGPLLVNAKGKAWTKDAINCAFCRLQVIMGRRAMDELGIGKAKAPRLKTRGIPPERLAEAKAKHAIKVKQWQKDRLALIRQHGPKYHLGAFRKGFTTEALKAGIDTVTVAHLLGHRDASMVSRVYGMVQQDPTHMAAAARKAKTIKADASASS